MVAAADCKDPHQSMIKLDLGVFQMKLNQDSSVIQMHLKEENRKLKTTTFLKMETIKMNLNTTSKQMDS